MRSKETEGTGKINHRWTRITTDFNSRLQRKDAEDREERGGGIDTNSWAFTVFTLHNRN
jgi:hypothetical protein